MERFAIKIDKSLKLSLSNLCRLCGIDKPDKVPILDPAAWNALNGIVDADSEPELCRKIYECVGIEVCIHENCIYTKYANAWLFIDFAQMSNIHFPI